MNTTFIPINTAQMQNALTDMGTWLGAYFPAFLGLALFIGALIIVPIVLKGLLNWIIDGIYALTGNAAGIASRDMDKMSPEEWEAKYPSV